MEAGDALGAVVREEGARVLATLTRVTGSLDLAEDAVQEAAVRALETWPRDGIPDDPRAWLLVAAKRRAIDRLRREGRRYDKEVAALSWSGSWSEGSTGPGPTSEAVVRDDLLRLFFTCCHPTLSLDAQVPLALRVLGGLTVPEIARGLLVGEPTVAKRLTRAKQKIATAHIPYRVPPADELPARLAGVAATIYLVFNEGYAPAAGPSLVRTDLAATAIRLARLLLGLMPDDPTALGLLSLVLLQGSRQGARTDEEGNPLLLAEQDRGRWDHAAIDEGVRLCARALHRSPEGPNRYAVQAAVAACHALAPSYAETRWDAVISWYDVLLTVDRGPVVRLNRAAAVAERDGAAEGLRLVDEIDTLDGYPWWHATRAELLWRLGRVEEGQAALARAARLGMSEPQLGRLYRRADEVRDAAGGGGGLADDG